MATIALPRTSGCLVCGRDNPLGLQLRLSIDEATAVVSTDVSLTTNHIGFTDVAHGGVVATIADEAMVWAATWRARRFCLCGELTIRYRRPVRPGVPLRFTANVVTSRSRLITTDFMCTDAHGLDLASGSAKYVPMSPEEHAAVVRSFLIEPASQQAAAYLANG